MGENKIATITVRTCACAVALVLLLACTLAWADWQKMSPPPDVDKAEHLHGNKPTCWVAAASNMLAGAGYGDGNNVQERADDIYTEICADLNDCNDTGWADNALNAWLASNHNKWEDNPYKVVTFYGHRNPRPPWANPNLPKFVGNQLRSCNMVRLSIRKPTCSTDTTGEGGHAITVWGDSGDNNDLAYDPNEVKVSDSDYWNTRQNVQTYSYDNYNDPNPDGCNEGNGWYLDYSQNKHWYIDGIVTLRTAEGNNPQTQKVVGSAQFQYTPADDSNATDLHYKIGTDKREYT